MPKYRLKELFDRCRILVDRVTPTTAGYRLLQINGLWIEDRSDHELYIKLGNRFDDGEVVHASGYSAHGA